MPQLVTATFGTATNLVEDNIVHDWVVQIDRAAAEAAIADISTAFGQLYNAAPTFGTAALGTYFSPIVNDGAGAWTLRVYDIAGFLGGQPHGSPWHIEAKGLTAAQSGTPLPSEVAVCVTLEGVGRADAAVEVPDGADPGDAVDRPKQRRTGRVYFGPLSANTVSIVNGVARPSTTFRTDLREAVRDLHGRLLDPTLPGGLGLGVWSRVDATVRALEAVSTDDSFDIQRRRGEKPTMRTRTAA